MTRQVDFVCPDHSSPYECPDNLIVYVPTFREYGLVVHDDGTAFSVIRFCPWCGAKLPESMRDRWFEELDRLGIDEAVDEVPVRFKDGTWLDAL